MIRRIADHVNADGRDSKKALGPRSSGTFLDTKKTTNTYGSSAVFADFYFVIATISFQHFPLPYSNNKVGAVKLTIVSEWSGPRRSVESMNAPELFVVSFTPFFSNVVALGRTTKCVPARLSSEIAVMLCLFSGRVIWPEAAFCCCCCPP